MKRLAFVLSFVLLSAGVLSAQTSDEAHPNVARGFSSDKMYHFGNIDAVNVFNGNLTVQIPLTSVTVSDHLSYTLSASYNLGRVLSQRRSAR
jgi:hypothetical protein